MLLLLLKMYVRFIDAGELNEDLLFCKQVISRATADELFKIIEEDCVGICTDGLRLWLGNGEGCNTHQAGLPQCAGGTLRDTPRDPGV